MDKQKEKLYHRWEWRTIICLMIGYALFYFVRKNFSMAIPAMEAQLGLSKVQLGIFLTLNGIIYGASRFVNGILVCMVMTTLCFIGFRASTSTVGIIAFLILSAFFIYGPQALYGTCASMQCTKYAAGTGNGVIGILGYLSTMVSGIWFGHIAGSELGWDRVYVLTIAFGIIGSLIIALLWKVPADGYEKVNKVIAENPEL